MLISSCAVVAIILHRGWRGKPARARPYEDTRPAQDQAEKERGRIKAKLTRLKFLYIDEGDLTEREYRQRKVELQARLDSLQEPEHNAVIQAGEYLDTLDELWDKATVKQRHRLLQGMVRKVRVDLSRERVVCIEPHSEFVALFREIEELKEKSDGCVWWQEEETITAC